MWLPEEFLKPHPRRYWVGWGSVCAVITAAILFMAIWFGAPIAYVSAVAAAAVTAMYFIAPFEQRRRGL
jgi:hypothetical protein